MKKNQQTKENESKLKDFVLVDKLKREYLMIGTYENHIDRLQVNHLPRPNTFTDFEHLRDITQESFNEFKSILKSKLGARKAAIEDEMNQHGKQETKQAAKKDSE